VEYDLDLSAAVPNVNQNLYTISPNQTFSSSGFDMSKYCDGFSSNWCVEVDWLESNGDCGGISTLHVIPGTGPNKCNAWGCSRKYSYDGNPIYHVKVQYGTDGKWSTFRDGIEIGPMQYNSSTSVPETALEWSILKNAYDTYGAVIYSSQWFGWVPSFSNCTTSSKTLADSVFKVTNFKITGRVIKGPTPTLCSSSSSIAPSPSNDPSKAPTSLPVSNCSSTWGQCGGKLWTGPTTCCKSTDSCVLSDAYYSQCKP
jgi:hypothetical protein